MIGYRTQMLKPFIGNARVRKLDGHRSFEYPLNPTPREGARAASLDLRSSQVTPPG